MAEIQTVPGMADICLVWQTCKLFPGITDIHDACWSQQHLSLSGKVLNIVDDTCLCQEKFSVLLTTLVSVRKSSQYCWQHLSLSWKVLSIVDNTCLCQEKFSILLTTLVSVRKSSQYCWQHLSLSGKVLSIVDNTCLCQEKFSILLATLVSVRKSSQYCWQHLSLSGKVLNIVDNTCLCQEKFSVLLTTLVSVRKSSQYCWQHLSLSGKVLSIVDNTCLCQEKFSVLLTTFVSVRKSSQYCWQHLSLSEKSSQYCWQHLSWPSSASGQNLFLVPAWIVSPVSNTSSYRRPLNYPPEGLWSLFLLWIGAVGPSWAADSAGRYTQTSRWRSRSPWPMSQSMEGRPCPRTQDPGRDSAPGPDDGPHPSLRHGLMDWACLISSQQQPWDNRHWPRPELTQILPFTEGIKTIFREKRIDLKS